MKYNANKKFAQHRGSMIEFVSCSAGKNVAKCGGIQNAPTFMHKTQDIENT